MILACDPCGEPASPDLPGLEQFDGSALCASCTEMNRRLQQGLEEARSIPLAVVDIDGHSLDFVAGFADATQQREARDRFGRQLWRWFGRELPALKDAYLSLGPAGRRAFQEYVAAVIRLRRLEQEEALANPFCLFRVVLDYCRLEPADDRSPYPGRYVGYRSRELFFPEALLAATRAWDAGDDVHLA